MDMSGWTLTELTEDQLQQVTAAEQSLGVGYLLVFRPAERPNGSPNEGWLRDLQAASLTETQLEYLFELERQLDGTIVAYNDSH